MLVDYKFENSKRTGDSDYHLVLKGESGKTMIAEIPSPACVDDNSPFRAAIKNARAEFDAKLHATGRFKNPKIPVSHGRRRGIFRFYPRAKTRRAQRN